MKRYAQIYELSKAEDKKKIEIEKISSFTSEIEKNSTSNINKKIIDCLNEAVKYDPSIAQHPHFSPKMKISKLSSNHFPSNSDFNKKAINFFHCPERKNIEKSIGI